MDKGILREYEAMTIEKKDIERRIAALEEELKRYENDYQEQDKVVGGSGGIQRFKIEGFPRPEYERKKTLLLTRKIRLEALKEEIESAVSEEEDYINRMSSPTMRMILRLRYIDGKSWEEVSKEMGQGYSKDAVRKKCERFMTGNKK